MKHWIFDLDGTLVDSFPTYFLTLSHIFRDYGVEFKTEHRLAALTDPLTGFFEKHLGPGTAEAAFEKLHKRSNVDAALVQPFDGAKNLLLDLKNSGAKIGVWTNRDFTSAELILKHTGLDQYLDQFVSGTCTIQRKPYPDGLLRIADAFGCGPDEVTMVGDHEHDMMAARSAGARSIRAGWHSHWKLENCSHADHQFSAFPEFHDWVKKNLSR